MEKDLNTKNEAIFARALFILIIVSFLGLIVNYIIAKEYWNILYFVLSTILSLGLSIIFHELGHLIFGLISGYSFLSFKFLFFNIYKRNNKIKFRCELSPILGQCLMTVKEEKKDKVHFLLYQLGGVIVNASLSILSILTILVLYFTINHFSYLLYSLALVNTYLFISNAIPLNANNIYNDGLNARLMKKYIEIRMGIINSLIIEGYFTADKGINEIKEELLNNDGYVIDNIIIHSYYYDYVRSVKKIINDEDDAFNLLMSRDKRRYNLPLIYLNTNSALLAFKRMVDDENYEYLFYMKENERYFKRKDNLITSLDNILFEYKGKKLEKDEAKTKIKKLYDELQGQTKVDQELYLVLLNRAIDYVDGKYTKKEVTNEVLEG